MRQRITAIGPRGPVVARRKSAAKPGKSEDEAITIRKGKSLSASGSVLSRLRIPLANDLLARGITMAVVPSKDGSKLVGYRTKELAGLELPDLQADLRKATLSKKLIPDTITKMKNDDRASAAGHVICGYLDWKGELPKEELVRHEDKSFNVNPSTLKYENRHLKTEPSDIDWYATQHDAVQRIRKNMEFFTTEFLKTHKTLPNVDEAKVPDLDSSVFVVLDKTAEAMIVHYQSLIDAKLNGIKTDITKKVEEAKNVSKWASSILANPKWTNEDAGKKFSFRQLAFPTRGKGVPMFFTVKELDRDYQKILDQSDMMNAFYTMSTNLRFIRGSVELKEADEGDLDLSEEAVKKRPLMRALGRLCLPMIVPEIEDVDIYDRANPPKTQGGVLYRIADLINSIWKALSLVPVPRTYQKLFREKLGLVEEIGKSDYQVMIEELDKAVALGAAQRDALLKKWNDARYDILGETWKDVGGYLDIHPVEAKFISDNKDLVKFGKTFKITREIFDGISNIWLGKQIQPAKYQWFCATKIGLPYARMTVARANAKLLKNLKKTGKAAISNLAVARPGELYMYNTLTENERYLMSVICERNNMLPFDVRLPKVGLSYVTRTVEQHLLSFQNLEIREMAVSVLLSSVQREAFSIKDMKENPSHLVAELASVIRHGEYDDEPKKSPDKVAGDEDDPEEEIEDDEDVLDDILDDE